MSLMTITVDQKISTNFFKKNFEKCVIEIEYDVSSTTVCMNWNIITPNWT